jgi:hypothetical protein
VAPQPVSPSLEPRTDDAFPRSEPDNQRTHQCFTAVFQPSSGQIHSDQTGKFVVASSASNNYVLVVFDYDSNSILVEPMRSRTGPCILTAFQTVHAGLVAAGLRPQLHRLDNECSAALKTFLHEADIDYRLVPPRLHRRNAAERAIHTFKNHFIAGFCSIDKNFPLHLWDKLLPQAELTLNLLRGSRLNPKLSAHAQMHGHFDCNCTPVAPPGIRVLVHVKPSERTTWSPHGVDGWYTGPALESYRCYTVWLWDTRAMRICDTLTWFPTKTTMPLASSKDLILAGMHDILHALQHPSPGSPLAPLTDSHHNVLVQLRSILTSVASPQLPPASARTSPTSSSIVSPVPIAIPPQADAPLRVDTTTHIDAAPLRVDATASIDAAPLRVPTLHRQAVTFAPLLTPTGGGATFANSTGAAGKERRRLRRQSKPSSATTPAKTVHPNKLFPPVPKRVVATHPHASRSKHLQHVAACARALLLDDARTPPSPFSHVHSPPAPHFAFHGHAINPDTGNIAEYRELSQCSEGPIWQASNADKIGRIAQGFGAIKGTNTICFIHPSSIPKDRKVTYLRVVSAMRPEKANSYRIRWTVGGDKIDYPFDISTKTADLTTAKLLFNSVLSTPNTRFLTADLKDFYLTSPMSCYEYMRVPIWMLPAAIIEQYNLTPLFHNGFVYVEIQRGMYGLPQAGRLANDQLIAQLAPHGYEPCVLTPGLWHHTTRDVVFSLVVDDFGIRYTSRADADHMITTLQAFNDVSLDWTGARYCGLSLKWDYINRSTCNMSMPGYVERALQRFQHVPPPTPEHAPHPWQRPNYGAKTQFALPPDSAPALDASDKTRILAVLGTLLFYARAIDSTMLTAIGELATEHSQATKTTMSKLTQLLNYCASHPDAVVRFTASDMLLAVESDASYLSVAKGRSRAAGYFLTTKLASSASSYQPNGAVHVLCHIMCKVLPSAAEAELGALFHNCKEACLLRIALEEMGHPQPATPMATDKNNTASGTATDTVKQKRSKAIDMRFYWIRDRVRQGQLKIYWSKGQTNRADYFSKHHPASHHQAIRSTYLYSPTNPTRNYFECLADTYLAPLPFVAPGEGVLFSPVTPPMTSQCHIARATHSS